MIYKMILKLPRSRHSYQEATAENADCVAGAVRGAVEHREWNAFPFGRSDASNGRQLALRGGNARSVLSTGCQWQRSAL
jgi:hypothetical protein